MKQRLIIIGASGHGKVVADIAQLNGYEDIVFLDDNESVKECAGFPVVGKTSDARDGEVFVAVGDATIRKQLMQSYENWNMPVLVHPNATIAHDVNVGEGTVIMAGAVINSGARIGKGVIVNTASSIDHDCVIGDYVHVAVGAHLCGSVSVGEKTWVGAGSIINNNISVCADSMIGSGTVIIHNIVDKGTYVGVPAKRISKRNLTGGGYALTLDSLQLFSERRAA